MNTILLLLLLITAPAGNAAQRKIENVAVDILGTKIVKAEVINGELDPKKDLELLGFTVESSKIAEIRKALGDAKVITTGDAALANTSVCYISQKGETIRFNSGEMGGGTLLTETEVSVAERGRDKDCLSTEKIKGEIRNVRGVHLGMTKSEIRKMFGKPSYQLGEDHLAFMYSEDIKSPTNPSCPEFSKTGTYDFKFEKGKLRSFSIGQESSC